MLKGFITRKKAGKVCSKCGKWRPLGKYTRDRHQPDGFHHTCRGCPARVCPRCQVRASDCRDLGGSLDKEFGNHRSYCKACLSEQQAVGGRLRSSRVAALRSYRARKREAEGTHTQEEIELLRLIYGDVCPVEGCGQPVEHVDHVEPLPSKSKGWRGTNWVSNLQWLCARHNIAKKDSHATDYRPDGGEAARLLAGKRIWEVREGRLRQMYAQWLKMALLRVETFEERVDVLRRAPVAKERVARWGYTRVATPNNAPGSPPKLDK